MSEIDPYKKFHVAREKGEQFIRPELREGVSLQVIKDINQLDTSLLNLEQFTDKAANLIRDRFGLYFVGLYLLRPETTWFPVAILWAGSGETGKLLKEGANPVLIEEDNDINISKAIRLNAVQLVNILPQSELANPFIPDSVLEMALPLRTPKSVIGALQICSCIPDSLCENDAGIFMSIADQIALKCVGLLQTEGEQ